MQILSRYLNLTKYWKILQFNCCERPLISTSSRPLNFQFIQIIIIMTEAWSIGQLNTFQKVLHCVNEINMEHKRKENVKNYVRKGTKKTKRFLPLLSACKILSVFLKNSLYTFCMFEKIKKFSIMLKIIFIIIFFSCFFMHE